jgi:hypothetical protein
VLKGEAGAGGVNMSETKWPVFIELCRVDGGIPLLYDESNHYHDALSYVRTDAARAWQALRDWLDGTAEQWQAAKEAAAALAYTQGYRHARGEI